MDEEARHAVRAWLDGELCLSVLGEGHINDTWLVEAQDRRFVLQRLSARVFPRPLEVARKVARVADHLSRNDRARVPALMTSAAGTQWHEDPQGGVWRLWAYASGTRTLEALRTVAQGEAAGAAFGSFQVALTGLPGEVGDPIPGFMQLPHYLADLDDVLSAGDVDSAAEAALAAVQPRRDLARTFRRRDRLIHGDCKINNLLFHARRDDVVGVIDLDTVMVGHWGWDFGDLVRSAAADRTRISVERFAAIARGFVRAGALARSGGTELADDLVMAPRYVALMLGARFLTDHLRGDRYFKVHSRGDNLARAAEQLALLEDMERRERDMRAAALRI